MVRAAFERTWICYVIRGIWASHSRTEHLVRIFGIGTCQICRDELLYTCGIFITDNSYAQANANACCDERVLGMQLNLNVVTTDTIEHSAVSRHLLSFSLASALHLDASGSLDSDADNQMQTAKPRSITQTVVGKCLQPS